MQERGSRMEVACITPSRVIEDTSANGQFTPIAGNDQHDPIVLQHHS
jgi:hypothetical protein